MPLEHLDYLPFSFSGHQTFPLRYAWLPKAVQHLQDYPDLFFRNDALVLLGVGKNMVQSIRHWSQAVGVIEQPRRHELHEVTELGKKLLSADGWDPYLEDPGTLWLLHWQLVSRPEKATTWCLAFTLWNKEAFTRDDLTDWLLRIVENRVGVRTTRNSIRRDVDVFIRTYVRSSATANHPLEETFDSPLVELGLLSELDRGVFGFARGEQLMLPDEPFIYALTDFWQKVAPKQQTLPFEVVLHGLGGPGGAFQLSESALVDRLERLPSWAGMRYDDTAGIRQLLRQESLGPNGPISVLERYYGAHHRPIS
jgi:hypothetical protein